MGAEMVLKIAGMGIVTSLVCLVLKRSDRDDIAMLAALAGLVAVLMMVITMLGNLFGELRSAFLLE